MTLAESQASAPSSMGEVRLVDQPELPGELSTAQDQGLLPVSLQAPGPALRGRLGEAIEEAVEAALERHGACPPGVGAATSLDASLSDQLYRSRLLERRGIALGVCSLEGIASLGGTLDADDSAVLRWWLRATKDRPIRLLLERDNLALGAYRAPCSLRDLLGESLPRTEPTPEAPLALSPSAAESTASMQLSEVPPAVIEHDGALSFGGASDADADAPEREDPEGEPETRAAETEGPSAAAPIGDIADAILKSLSDSERGSSRPAPSPSPVSVPPLYPAAEKEWEGWARDLSRARGPKPLTVVERMFVSSYLPLSTAFARGLGGQEAATVLQSWGDSFAQSYRDAFDALRIRTKRPTMVLDAPELALRIGRLHGARSIQLVLVDGMRFDLGLRVEQRIRARVGQAAALTERLLLWAALPTTTETQIGLLGRGAPGLKELTQGVESKAMVARGRAASTLRRVRTGHRDLLKLDIVEARLAEPGPPEAERLDQIADETAAALSEYLGKQPSRTLVFTFGDHGFVLDPLDGGTAAARSGGASPEEVLVPAFAWLVGGVH